MRPYGQDDMGGRGMTRFQRRRMLPRTPGAGVGVNTGRPGRPPEAVPPAGMGADTASAASEIASRPTRPMQFSGQPGAVADTGRPKWDAPQQFQGRTFGAQPIGAQAAGSFAPAGEQFQRQIRPPQGLPMPTLPPWLRPQGSFDAASKLPMPGQGPDPLEQEKDAFAPSPDEDPRKRLELY